MVQIQKSSVVVVTGATAGVGRAVALQLARSQCKLGLVARDEPALNELAAELANVGAETLSISTDLADAAATMAAAGRIEHELGPIDVWINNAMVTVISPFATMTPEEFLRVTEVTYLGAVHGTMAALHHMRPRDSGLVLQIGSALAYRGIPLQSAYCGAKHAVRGFSESVRSELIHDKSRIRVAIVDLPAVNTPQFGWARARVRRTPRPMGRPASPHRVAEAVVRAIESGGEDYWIGWPTALTVLGNAVAPGFLDRYLARAVEGQQSNVSLPQPRKDNLFSPAPGHRPEGDFTAEATAGAPLLPARAGRLAVIVFGALTFFALGMLAA